MKSPGPGANDIAPGKIKHVKKDGPGSLRSIAEKKFAKMKGGSRPVPGTSTEEIIHELSVHQIELEMQNEALREAQHALEESRDKYVDLYDFAPVGYLTLTSTAIIEEANLTVTRLLGIDLRKLRKDRFRTYVFEEDLEIWDRHFVAALHSPEKQTIDLMLRRKDGSLFDARLESIRMERENKDPVVRIAISDISAFKRVEEALQLSENRFRTFF